MAQHANKVGSQSSDENDKAIQNNNGEEVENAISNDTDGSNGLNVNGECSQSAHAAFNTEGDFEAEADLEGVTANEHGSLSLVLDYSDDPDVSSNKRNL